MVKGNYWGKIDMKQEFKICLLDAMHQILDGEPEIDLEILNPKEKIESYNELRIEYSYSLIADDPPERLTVIDLKSERKEDIYTVFRVVYVIDDNEEIIDLTNLEKNGFRVFTYINKEIKYQQYYLYYGRKLVQKVGCPFTYLNLMGYVRKYNPNLNSFLWNLNTLRLLGERIRIGKKAFQVKYGWVDIETVNKRFRRRG